MSTQPTTPNQPAPSPAASAPRPPRRLGMVFGCAALVGGLCGAGAWYYFAHKNDLPPNIAVSNGRLEMTRLDIAVKYPGRITDITFHEGDHVQAGQPLAYEDNAEITAQLAGARANFVQAQETVSRAKAEQEAAQAAATLASQELRHARQMAAQHLVSDMEVQERQTAYTTRTLSAQAAEHAAASAQAATTAAASQIDRLQTVLNDMTVKAPVSGQIEYKVAERGAVLAGGGRVASLLAPSDTYLTVFFPSETAGKLHVGDEARIQLDALGTSLLPARISFVSPEAQFTPKYVETATEREKLVYRIKLQIMPDTVAKLGGALKAGMTGEGYVRTSPSAQWPAPKQQEQE